MNTNLCEKCGATIPLRTLSGDGEAVPRSDHSCMICDPPRKARGKKGFWSILMHVVMLSVFVGFGIGLQKCSFRKVAEIRQLARVPQTQVQAAVPGEINLTGTAQPIAGDGGQVLISSPDTRTKCLYYRYLVEREERDSDGGTRWVTVSDRYAYVKSFHLTDRTGEIEILPSDRVEFNVPRSNRRRSGKMRYSEYRLDPEDSVFVFGFAESVAGGDLFVGFERPGDYQPLISEKTELRERTGRASSSIFLCWFGLVLIGATTVVLFSLTGRHGLLTYFWVLSMAVGAVLFILGIAMMRSDLRAASQRVAKQHEVVQKVIADELESAGEEWDGDWDMLGDFSERTGLSAAQQARLQRVRVDLAAASRRVDRQARKFPYNLIAGTVELEEIKEVPLPDGDEQVLDTLESKFQSAKLTGWSTWLWGILGLAGTFLATKIGFRKVKVKRMTENLATSPTRGVAYGLTELNGVIDMPEGVDPLRGPLTRKPCISFVYTIKERRGSGKNAKWVEIHRETNKCRFLCRDAEGTIPIDPEGADIMAWRSDSDRQGRRIHNETRLQFGDPLYAMGMAKIDPQTGDSLYMCEPELEDEPFVLSSYTEEAVVKKRGIGAIMVLTFAFASVLLSGLMLFASRGAFSPADYLAAALVGPAYLVVLTVILHYNDLVFLRQRARRNWSNIEVSLRKRYDLMPQMIEIARAFIKHESDLQTGLTDLRGSYGGGIGLNPEVASEFLAEGQLLGGAFMGRIEEYPEIKAATQTALVMRQLIALEDEIAFMRAGYNDAVTQYNTRIRQFPDQLLADMGKFKPMDLLEYEAKVIPMPEIEQETWRRHQAVEAAAAAEASEGDGESAAAETGWVATVLPSPDPDAPVTDALDERVLILASLIDEEGEMRQRQLDLIGASERDGDAVAAAVAAQVETVQSRDPWALLHAARDAMPALRTMSAEAYLHFKGMARLLIEADERISIYEYAFQKALAFLVDPVFTPHEQPELRYTERADLEEQLSNLKTYLADPTDDDELGSFDAALIEVYHANSDLRAEIYRECHEAFVEAGGERASVRFVLLQALADGLFLAAEE